MILLEFCEPASLGGDLLSVVGGNTGGFGDPSIFRRVLLRQLDSVAISSRASIWLASPCRIFS